MPHSAKISQFFAKSGKKCEKTIEIDEYINKLDEGYLNNTSYKWNKDMMSASNIVSFSLTLGDCPNVNIIFEDNMIICYNRIKSKDSWKSFSEDFFDEKTVKLSKKEIKKVYRYLDIIKFERWENDENILSNYIKGSDGFGVDKTFCCKFNNDIIFRCFNPKGVKYGMLLCYLKKLVCRDNI